MPPRRLTKGIEEEVYTGTWQGDVVGLSHRVAAALPGFTTEPDARNVEFTTDPYRDYEVLLSRLMTKRCQLRRYLREIGEFTLIPGSTIPLGDTREFHLSDPNNPYYVFIRDTYGTNVVTASHHVNVGIEETDALFRAYRVLRSEASMFLALTAASPFLGGETTGFHSSRWGLFPKTPRSVPFFAGHDEFASWVEARLADGTMYNPRHLWIAARPNGHGEPLQPQPARAADLRAHFLPAAAAGGDGVPRGAGVGGARGRRSRSAAPSEQRGARGDGRRQRSGGGAHQPRRHGDRLEQRPLDGRARLDPRAAGGAGADREGARPDAVPRPHRRDRRGRQSGAALARAGRARAGRWSGSSSTRWPKRRRSTKR